MAEHEKKPEEERQADEQKVKPKKKGLMLGGGLIGLIAAAYILSLAAVPKKPKELPFNGPFVADIAGEKIQVNLRSDSGKRYLVTTLKAEYFGYDEVYAATRIAEPLYMAMLKDALIDVATQKTKDDIDDAVGKEIFKEEIVEVVDPILFPVHIGNPADPHGQHEESGFLPGKSNRGATLRGGFRAHKLHVDTDEMTVRFDEGESVTYTGVEQDLELANEQGATVFVDVTRAKPGFAGEVPVGTFGSVKNIYFESIIFQ